MLSLKRPKLALIKSDSKLTSKKPNFQLSGEVALGHIDMLTKRATNYACSIEERNVALSTTLNLVAQNRDEFLTIQYGGINPEVNLYRRKVVSSFNQLSVYLLTEANFSFDDEIQRKRLEKTARNLAVLKDSIIALSRYELSIKIENTKLSRLEKQCKLESRLIFTGVALLAMYSYSGVLSIIAPIIALSAAYFIHSWISFFRVWGALSSCNDEFSLADMHKQDIYDKLDKL